MTNTEITPDADTPAISTKESQEALRYYSATQWQLMWWRFRKHRLARSPLYSNGVLAHLHRQIGHRNKDRHRANDLGHSRYSGNVYCSSLRYATPCILTVNRRLLPARSGHSHEPLSGTDSTILDWRNGRFQRSNQPAVGSLNARVRRQQC